MSLLQNNYLQYIIGGYKYIPRVALEREIVILLLDLYVKVTTLQRIIKIINYPIKHYIKIIINNIWEAAQELVI